MEQLAAYSFLARLLDQCKIKSADNVTTPTND